MFLQLWTCFVIMKQVLKQLQANVYKCVSMQTILNINININVIMQNHHSYDCHTWGVNFIIHTDYTVQCNSWIPFISSAFVASSCFFCVEMKHIIFNSIIKALSCSECKIPFRLRFNSCRRTCNITKGTWWYKHKNTILFVLLFCLLIMIFLDKMSFSSDL